MSSWSRDYCIDYLVALDFDGCLAATFIDSPNGVNVSKASRLAINQIFGEEGDKAYVAIGGLQNRDPEELVRLILEKIDNPMKSGSVKELVETFVTKKLSHLLPEITPEWPLLYPGVREFMQTVEDGQLPITTAVVSSGHDDFINRVFDVNGLPPPRILVTSDIIRSKETPHREKYKPYPYQLAISHYQWKKQAFAVDKNYAGRDQGKSHMIYIGDDPIKDGGLAE